MHQRRVGAQVGRLLADMRVLRAGRGRRGPAGQLGGPSQAAERVDEDAQLARGNPVLVRAGEEIAVRPFHVGVADLGNGGQLLELGLPGLLPSTTAFGAVCATRHGRTSANASLAAAAAAVATAWFVP